MARGLCRVCGKHGRPGKNYCAECTEKKRDRELTQRYGISSREYDVLLARQGGGCAICGSVPLPGGLRSASRLNVDHGHSTNRVRGLLCHRCNMGLGYFGDDPTRLRVAALYVAAKRRAPTLSDVLRAEHELVGVGGGSWAALEEHLDGCSCDACHVSGKEGPA